ncbi:hypothetical protein HYZ64_03010 [Candidatus Berkelbacteria bacterium]|nr:hypothetical protein [Candidatus Berkelbacteria bacterium]
MIIGFLIGLSLLGLPVIAGAQGTVDFRGKAPDEFKDVLPDPRTIENLPTRFQSLAQIVATIFNIVIGISGAIFMVLLLVGGIQYMTAAGNEENTTKAKKLLVDAVIGLVLTLSAWAIGTFILRQFYGPTSDIVVPRPTTNTRPPSGPTGGGTQTQVVTPNWTNYLSGAGSLDENAFHADCTRFGGVPSGRNCTINGKSYTLQENGDVT